MQCVLVCSRAAAEQPIENSHRREEGEWKRRAVICISFGSRKVRRQLVASAYIHGTFEVTNVEAKRIVDWKIYNNYIDYDKTRESRRQTFNSAQKQDKKQRRKKQKWTDHKQKLKRSLKRMVMRWQRLIAQLQLTLLAHVRMMYRKLVNSLRRMQVQLKNGFARKRQIRSSLKLAKWSPRGGRPASSIEARWHRNSTNNGSRRRRHRRKR